MEFTLIQISAWLCVERAVNESMNKMFNNFIHEYLQVNSDSDGRKTIKHTQQKPHSWPAKILLGRKSHPCISAGEQHQYCLGRHSPPPLPHKRKVTYRVTNSSGLPGTAPVLALKVPGRQKLLSLGQTGLAAHPNCASPSPG